MDTFEDTLESEQQDEAETARIAANQINRPSELKEYAVALRQNGCTLCDLGGKLGRVCVSRGSLKATLMIVGQNPGATELEEGQPFVGPAGKLLDKQLEESNIVPNFKAYWTNVGLCGTEGNAPLTKKQADACRIHLRTQIKLLAPIAIIAVGKPSLNSLVPACEPMKAFDCVGKKYTYSDIEEGIYLPVYPILHTAFILRKGNGTEEFKKFHNQNIEALKIVRQVLQVGAIDRAEAVF